MNLKTKLFFTVFSTFFLLFISNVSMANTNNSASSEEVSTSIIEDSSEEATPTIQDISEDEDESGDEEVTIDSSESSD